MRRVLAEKGARDFLAAKDPAFMHVICDGEQFAGKRLHAFRLGACICSSLLVASNCLQFCLSGPAGDQGGIEPRRTLIGPQGAVRVAQRALQVAFLLVGAAIIRSDRHQFGEARARVCMAAFIAGANGGDIEGILVCGLGRQNGPCDVTRCREIASLNLCLCVLQGRVLLGNVCHPVDHIPV